MGEPASSPVVGHAPVRVLLLLAAVVGVACFVIGWWLFPSSSPVVDERVYLQQAQALRDGHLVLPSHFRDDHRPFFTAPNADGELVFKYPPLWPAVLAGAELLTGTSRAAVAVVASLAALGVGLLAWELSARRSVAILAAVAVAGAPLFVMLGASRLSYGLGFALAAWAALAMIRAARTGTGPTALGAGALAGTCVALRPFDAVLVLGVFGPWVRWTERPGRPARLLGLLSLGAAVPLGVLAWTNWATTGDPLQLPFTLVGPDDRLGFGQRLDVPTGEPFDFTLGKGLQALGRGLSAWAWWGPFGVAGLALVVWGLWRAPRRLRVLLVAWIVVVPVGYVFFWGSWNGFVRLDVVRYFGPFYYLPVIIPVAIACSLALGELQIRWRRLLVPAGLGVAVLGVLAPLQFLREYEDGLSGRMDHIEGASPQASDALVVLEVKELLYQESSFNDVDLDGTVYAVDRPGRQVQLLERFDDRPAIRERLSYVLDGRPGTPTSEDVLGFARQSVFEPVELLRGARFDFDVTMPGLVATGTRLVVRTDRTMWMWSEPDGSALISWDGSIPRAGAEIGSGEPLVPGVDPGLLCVGRRGPGEDPGADYDEVCFDWARRDGELVLVTPGRGATRFAVGEPVMLDADVSDRIVVVPRPATPAVTGGS